MQLVFQQFLRDLTKDGEGIINFAADVPSGSLFIDGSHTHDDEGTCFAAAVA